MSGGGGDVCVWVWGGGGGRGGKSLPDLKKNGHNCFVDHLYMLQRIPFFYMLCYLCILHFL